MIIMRNILVLLILTVGLLSCKKDKIEVADLTNNPFDSDYSGAPIFTVQSVETVTIILNGESVRRLTVVVRVHRESMEGNPPFYVNITPENGDPVSRVQSNMLVNDEFELTKDNVAPGDMHCWRLDLGNGESLGAGNQVCGTAD